MDKTAASTIWDNKKILERLELLRDKMRKEGKRLTFDCLNLKHKGDRAYCSLGKRLTMCNDGTIALVTVLRGYTSGTCKECLDFSTEEVK